jgi:hypothetical protein
VTDTTEGRDSFLERLDRAWNGIEERLERLGDEQFRTEMPTGWNPAEMLGHLAFWAECTKPVVVAMLRGDVDALADWRFGSGFIPDDTQPWPVDTVHNAREAEWARRQTRAEIEARLRDARQLMRIVIESLSDTEEREPKFVDYLNGSLEHLEEHGRELAAAAAEKPPAGQ